MVVCGGGGGESKDGSGGEGREGDVCVMVYIDGGGDPWRYW